MATQHADSNNRLLYSDTSLYMIGDTRSHPEETVNAVKLGDYGAENLRSGSEHEEVMHITCYGRVVLT